MLGISTLSNQNDFFDLNNRMRYISQMPSKTVEDYVKQLYFSEQELPTRGSLVSMGDISSRMNVQPGTATSMMKTLQDAGLVQYEPRQGVRLTAGGRKLALHLIRSHRLIEQFLVRVLGYDWSEVHDEAEALEHVVSEKFISKIDTLLEFPETDPHGDPIPTANGKINNIESIPATDMLKNTSYIISRIGNQESSFLNILSEYKVIPNNKVFCLDNDSVKGIITLKSPSKQELILSSAMAAHIFVTES